jgi:hypothetical protein
MYGFLVYSPAMPMLTPGVNSVHAQRSRHADTARQRAWAAGLAAWRRRAGLAPGARVFVLTGPFPDARAALAARGWAENPDPASACFQLKWSLRAREAWVRARLPRGRVGYGRNPRPGQRLLPAQVEPARARGLGARPPAAGHIGVGKGR